MISRGGPGRPPRRRHPQGGGNRPGRFRSANPRTCHSNRPAASTPSPKSPGTPAPRTCPLPCTQLRKVSTNHTRSSNTTVPPSRSPGLTLIDAQHPRPRPGGVRSPCSRPGGWQTGDGFHSRPTTRTGFGGRHWPRDSRRGARRPPRSDLVGDIKGAAVVADRVPLPIAASRFRRLPHRPHHGVMRGSQRHAGYIPRRMGVSGFGTGGRRPWDLSRRRVLPPGTGRRDASLRTAPGCRPRGRGGSRSSESPRRWESSRPDLQPPPSRSPPRFAGRGR